MEKLISTKLDWATFFAIFFPIRSLIKITEKDVPLSTFRRKDADEGALGSIWWVSLGRNLQLIIEWIQIKHNWLNFKFVIMTLFDFKIS
jgi:hypothetical protein